MEGWNSMGMIGRIKKNDRDTMTLLASAEARHELEEQLTKDLEKHLKTREAGVQYLQSLLFWNLPSHLICIMIIVYLAVYYVDVVIVQRLLLFQTLGIAMMVIAVRRESCHCCRPKLLFCSSAQRFSPRSDIGFGVAPSPPRSSWKRLPSKPLSSHSTLMSWNLTAISIQRTQKAQAWIIWPEDATTYSAETYPFGVRTFLGKVKLYDFHTVMRWMAGMQLACKGCAPFFFFSCSWFCSL